MSDEDMIAALDAARREYTCKVCDARDAMSDRARSAVDAALASKIGHRRLARILAQSGYVVGERAVIFHRSEHTAHKRN